MGHLNAAKKYIESGQGSGEAEQEEATGKNICSKIPKTNIFSRTLERR
jgi:hypothetical protein